MSKFLTFVAAALFALGSSAVLTANAPAKPASGAKAEKPAEAPEKEADAAPSGPLLDLSDAAVKKMIKQYLVVGHVVENINHMFLQFIFVDDDFHLLSAQYITRTNEQRKSQIS